MRGKVPTVVFGFVLGALVSATAAEGTLVYRGRAEVTGPAMLSLDGKRSFTASTRR